MDFYSPLVTTLESSELSHKWSTSKKNGERRNSPISNPNPNHRTVQLIAIYITLEQICYANDLYARKIR